MPQNMQDADECDHGPLRRCPGVGHAWLFIETNAGQAGAGRVTLAVVGLDALLERLATERIEHKPIEVYSNGVRHVKVPDPDGNAIALAEPPDVDG